MAGLDEGREKGSRLYFKRVNEGGNVVNGLETHLF